MNWICLEPARHWWPGNAIYCEELLTELWSWAAGEGKNDSILTRIDLLYLKNIKESNASLEPESCHEVPYVVLMFLSICGFLGNYMELLHRPRWTLPPLSRVQLSRNVTNTESQNQKWSRSCEKPDRVVARSLEMVYRRNVKEFRKILGQERALGFCKHSGGSSSRSECPQKCKL